MGDDGFAEIPTPLSEQVERRIAASKDYDMLQGLVGVWVGCGILLSAATGYVSWLAILGGVGSAVGAGWYEKRYGKQRSSNNRTAITLLISCAAILAICIATGMDHWHPGPILWGPLVSAGMLVLANVLGYRHIGATIWHWLCAAGVALASLGPLLDWHPSRIGSLIPLGIALIITGWIDHRRLVSIFGKGSADD